MLENDSAIEINPQFLFNPAASSCRSLARLTKIVADNVESDASFLEQEKVEKAMIRPTVVALALCVVFPAYAMPYVPLQQPDNPVIQVRQGCGLGRQLVDGICVRNSAVRAAVRKCSARKMRMVNGRCEPRTATRPAPAPAAASPTTQQPAATPATSR